MNVGTIIIGKILEFIINFIGRCIAEWIEVSYRVRKFKKKYKEQYIDILKDSIYFLVDKGKV
ncbi:MAG: hypothetical protein ABF630_11430 [Liquorilactobacillus sp.]|uniref:hypothetical protein n=1 Tax=Liquorilactobacillus nagelii TaxID=82688 RepID=UPI0039ECD076